MNRIIRVTALAAALAAAAPASAQQGAAKPRVGLGVGLPAAEFAPVFAAGVTGGALAPQLYVPINVSPVLRIEPQVGLLTSHDDQTGDEISFKSLGAGVFYVAPLGGPLNMYVGGRLVLSFFEEKNVGGGGAVTKTTGTDWYIAAAGGGEYSVHPRFSVGVEGQLGYTAIGDRDVTTPVGTQTQQGGSSWMTQGLLFARVYLF